MVHVRPVQILISLAVLVIYSSSCNPQEDAEFETQVHPVTLTNKIIKDRKLIAIYIFPNWLFRDKSNNVMVGDAVGSVKIDSIDQIRKFSELFENDVKYTTEIPELIPNPANRNTILFYNSSDVSLVEWCLFRLESGWWFMIKRSKPKGEDGEYTNFMKCGERMGNYMDGLIK